MLQGRGHFDGSGARALKAGSVVSVYGPISHHFQCAGSFVERRRRSPTRPLP